MRVLTFIFILITFISCDDIVNSDKNIKITEIKYKSINENQENGVVLPLKVGNKWYYGVDEYSGDGVKLAEYIDSILVKNEYEISGERWFEVYFPMLSNDNILMTNTDVGLWVKCDNCENQSFLMAKYPDYQEVSASGFTDIHRIPISNSDDYNLLSILLISKKTNTENVSVPKGNYDCIKYTSQFESDDNNISQFPITEEYFSVDIGLIKFVQNQLLTYNTVKVYDLIEKPSNTNDCIETLTVNVGNISNGTNHEEFIDLKNTTANRLSVLEIQIDYIGLQDIANISEPFVNSLPITIVSGQKANMIVNISPNQTGRFIITIKVISNIGCFYEITLEGRSV